MKAVRGLALRRTTCGFFLACALSSVLLPGTLVADDCKRDWRRAED
jgi:hypothetical protein